MLLGPLLGGGGGGPALPDLPTVPPLPTGVVLWGGGGGPGRPGGLGGGGGAMLLLEGGREEGGGGGCELGGGGGAALLDCIGLLELGGTGGGPGLFVLGGGGGGADKEGGGGGVPFPSPGDGGGGNGRPTILGGREEGGGGRLEFWLWLLKAPWEAPLAGAGGPLLGVGGGCGFGTPGAAPIFRWFKPADDGRLKFECEFNSLLKLFAMLATELDPVLLELVSLGLFWLGGGGGGPPVPLPGPFITLLLFVCPPLFAPGSRIGLPPGAKNKNKPL